MKIGELARRTGVSVRSLRYYEQQQLLLAGRTSGGQRTYADDADERVELIQLLFGAGVPSRDRRPAAAVHLLRHDDPGDGEPARRGAGAPRRARPLRSVATRDRLDGVLAAARKRLQPAA